MQKINKILQFVACIACVSGLDATENSNFNKTFDEDINKLNLKFSLSTEPKSRYGVNNNGIDFSPGNLNSLKIKREYTNDTFKDLTISPSKTFFERSSIVDFDLYMSSNTRNSTGKKVSKDKISQDAYKPERKKLSMQDSSVLKENDIGKISQYIDEYCQPLGSAKKCLYSKFKVSISNYQYKTSEGMIYSCIKEYNDQKGQLVARIFTTKNQLDKVTSCTKYFNDFSYKKVLRLRVNDKELQSLHEVFKKDDVKEMIPYLSQAGFTILRSGSSYYATLDKYEHNLNANKSFPLRGSQIKETETSNQNLSVLKVNSKKTTSIEKIQQKVQPMALNEQQILRIKQYLFNYGQPTCGYSKTIGLNHQNHALLEIWKYFDSDISAIATHLRKAGFVIVTQGKKQLYYISLPEYKETYQEERWNRLEDTVAQDQKIRNIHSYIEKFGIHIRGFSKAVRLQNNTAINKLLTEFVPNYLTNTEALKKAGFEIVNCISVSYITSLKYKEIIFKKSKIEEKLENLNKWQ